MVLEKCNKGLHQNDISELKKWQEFSAKVFLLILQTHRVITKRLLMCSSI